MSDLEVRYLGTIGSYSHEIALQYIELHNLKNITLNSYSSITDIIFSPIKYNNTIMVLPLENTTSGDVYETYYQLYQCGFNIIGAMQLEIVHVLVSKKNDDISKIDKVYSHPQALLQVSKYLMKNNMIGVPDFSTADAMERVSKTNESIAAIGSKYSLKYFDNLKILDEKVSNNEINYTRFIICKPLKKTEQYLINLNHDYDEGYLFLLFELNQDQSGELTKVLDLLSQFNINLFSIKSRPTEGKAFEYFFVVESLINQKVDHHKLTNELKNITKNYIYNTYNK